MTQYSLKNRKYLTISIFIFISIWQIVATVVGNKLLLPSFFNVLYDIYTIIISDTFINIILSSIFRCIESFIISLLISIILSVASYFSKFIYNFLYPIIVFLKSIPTMAFIVLILIWTSKDSAPVIIGVVISFPIFYDVILNSLLDIDKNLLQVCTVYRISTIDKILIIIIPMILIEIKKVINSTLSLIFKVVISGEVYAQPTYGIGSIIQFEKMQLNTSIVIAWMIIITFIVCFFDFIIDKTFNKKGG
ncbi:MULTISPECIES: ABC transporter permease [unclassified Clostridium]|jgi:NitT/TauT family transport system permease protein|uniref:ABC transporter permease n=1 Tax=unclassified Clostridium TaxID=2614128 RepID=UPI001C8CC098|nr:MULTISPECIES: ABC transporter permease [unclassified Clostridium]MBX9139375.1 ABC transporter permease [Clostridium sp. K12(2020)]MBX9146115.1 ABC transporter permease [Clostridium sp. K13]